MANASNSTTRPHTTWDIQKIRNLVELKFGKRPCWFQTQVATALHEGKDVVGCAATGAGKSLSFYIKALMSLEDGEDKMMIMASPLKVLAKQNVQAIKKAGLSAIAVSSRNANKKTFKNIEAGKYNVVIMSPEILMSKRMEAMWSKKAVVSRLSYFVFDEGHCVSQWSSFRKEYAQLGTLRALIPKLVPFYVASATLPPSIFAEVVRLLQLRPAPQTKVIAYSNDRPDIFLTVRGLRYPVKSFRDLDFLIPKGWKEGDLLPEKFVIFFDNIKEAQSAVHHLRTLLPKGVGRKVIKYFHAVMSDEYREKAVVDLREGRLWGICATDAFGMGMDLPDIKLVIQWKATCDFSTLWQRFGRTARGRGVTGTALLLVEPKHLDEK
ncbi:P-loop containing nucleoside triphosphate hydrolase protein, partial [Pluteus cervinus]